MQDKLKAMQEGGEILAKILQELKEKTKPGVTKRDIDDWSRRLCLKYKVKPSFLNYDGFPGAICISINDELVHGAANEVRVKEGDIVSLDFGVYHDGFHTDSAITFSVGQIDEATKNLLDVTEKSLYLGIDAAKVGNHIGDIGEAVQRFVESRGFGVVRSLVGHGISREVHEQPMVPNFGHKGEGPLIKEGMTIAIEPMVTAGDYEVVQAEDGWTYKTKDNSLCAHFEHTIYISKDGPIILTKC